MMIIIAIILHFHQLHLMMIQTTLQFLQLGGDEIIPDDGPDDTPAPPKPIAFNNDVTRIKQQKR